MEYTVEALTKRMEQRRDDSMALEYERQLRVSYEKGELSTMIGIDGRVKYDKGAIAVAWSAVIDEIDRELGVLELREYITNDIREDVMSNIE
jgi:hypothetical protein